MAERRKDETAEEAMGGATAAPKRGLAWPGWRDPIVATLVYLVAVSALFAIFPGIDTGIAGLFHDQTGFPASRIATLVALRHFGEQTIGFVLIVLLAAILAKILWPLRPMGVRPRSIVFLVAGLALGPGLVVNAIFKNFSGRPRPIQVDLFGGPDMFMRAWQFGGQCVQNCSFISGEAATAIWLVSLVLLAPKTLRPFFAVPLGVVILALSINRMAFGGHFASDVMISWGITLLIILVLHRVIILGPLGPRIDRAVERALTRAGIGLRQFASGKGAHKDGPERKA
ncbi:phosphatase PAP2 family protein [Kaistia dalseonensis]|uniref:Membrane-associated phospholipid phosphatase n=1 Tax=Kaistia dalseonensis TaxID=410840 RepID=A0ABU0H8S0_9HYPH|nr:phosphatase PAP2 family protein [Kaistia dalseonensis]MCX5496108.1 phosphatase PAP2 family protein [Kaistia dalseonensis]MDQ0438713.1 membrane-associated phospholipid phosphatase [Kaistia dalseonensis]